MMVNEKEGKTEKDMAQEDIIAWAESEVDKLVALDFTRDIVPPSIEIWQVHILKAQRLLAEGDYEGFAQILIGDIRDLNLLTAEEMEIFERAVKTEPTELLNQFFDSILVRTNEAQKKRLVQQEWDAFNRNKNAL